MAVSVMNAAQAEEESLNTTINTTPLVDVMLVLLIIFLVTIPVAAKLVPLTLPPYRNIVTVTKPENIVIHVDKDENLSYNSDLATPIDIPNLNIASSRRKFRRMPKANCSRKFTSAATRMCVSRRWAR